MIFSRSLLAIRASARAFARAPGLTLALLFTIALGVGSNASVYGFIQGLIHGGSPLTGADGVASIFGQDRIGGAGPLTGSEYRLLKNHPDAFDWVGAARITPSNITIGERSEIGIVAYVTANLAQALKLPPGVGPVISHHMWQSDFGGKADVIGNEVRVDDVDLRITGIAPDRLEGIYSDRAVDLWISIQDQGSHGADLSERNLWVFGHLRRGVSLGQAQAGLRLNLGPSRRLTAIPFTGTAPQMAREFSHIGIFLNFSAGAIYFIACINVASLLLGRALRRSHETSLRIALGATRANLMWELLSDSVVISVAGGVLGILLAVCTTHAIPAFLFEEDAERLVFAPHLLPIITASASCVGIIAVCGMMPVFATVTDRPWTILQREAGLPSKTMARLRACLVIGQITACCVLVICTAILLESLHSALETGAGRRLGNPILVTVQAPAQPEVDINYFKEVEQRARSAGNLSPLAWTTRLPGSRPTWRSFRVQPPSSQFRDVQMDIAWLTPDSLKLFDNRPVVGRMFGIDDQARKVAMVDEETAAELFGPETVGMVIRDSSGQPIEIIGVLRRDAKYAMQQKRPTIYYGYIDQPDAPNPIRLAHFRVPLVSPLMDIQLNTDVVSPSYFSALGMPLIAGREFPESQEPGQGRMGLINQEAADLYFSGKPLSADVIDERGVRTEIIGVVGSLQFGTFQQHAEPAIYFPMWQERPPRMTLMLRDSKWNGRILADLRRRVESIPGHDSAHVVVKTLDTQLAQSAFAPLRIATLVGGASAAIALVLSVFGVFSAQSDAERLRRRELALHIALGAQRWRIAFMVMKDTARLATAGTVVGTSVSLALFRLLLSDTAIIASPPFQVWLIAPLLPAVAVMMASVIPMHRASTITPMEIMRA